MSFYADNVETWPESQQVKLLRAHKERMRRWLNKAAAASVRLEILPENPEEIPVSLFAAAFPTGLIPGSPEIMDKARLRRVIADFRLRAPKEGMSSMSVLPASGQVDPAALCMLQPP